MVAVAKCCIGYRHTAFCILMVFAAVPFSLHRRNKVSDAHCGQDAFDIWTVGGYYAGDREREHTQRKEAEASERRERS